MKTRSLEQIVYRLLMARAKGKKHGYQAALKRGKILRRIAREKGFSEMLQANTSNNSPDRIMRMLIRRMEKNGYRLGSHSKYGYFPVLTAKDLELAIEQRHKQLRALSQSIRWQRRNFQNLTQRRMNFRGAA